VIGGWLSAGWPRAAERPGLLATAAVLLVLLGFSVSVDFPRAAHGFKGDEATYYSLTYSLARDSDFAFQRRDLVRVWDEYPGPEGIFLKRGSKVDVERSSRFPFFRLVYSPDPARSRLFYGKSYIYPLFAAPFVRLFGTNGFLIFHALLLALNFAAAYAFLKARGSPPVAAAAFAAAFIFVSVVPIYFVWITPELFNFSLVLQAYFLWTYKLAASEAPGSRWQQFLMSSRSDYLAAAHTRAADLSDARVRPVDPPNPDLDRRWGDLRRCRVRAAAGQHRHDRRIQLSGRRAEDVLRANRFSFCQHLGDVR
jgi:hypothetical protein